MTVNVITNFNHLDDLARNLQGAVNDGLEELGARIYDEAYANTARDTGALAESLGYEVTPDGTLTHAYGEDYAPDVELGTAYQAGQPALGPAFDHHATPEAVADVVSKGISDAVDGG